MNILKCTDEQYEIIYKNIMIILIILTSITVATTGFLFLTQNINMFGFFVANVCFGLACMWLLFTMFLMLNTIK